MALESNTFDLFIFIKYDFPVLIVSFFENKLQYTILSSVLYKKIMIGIHKSDQ